MVGFGTLPRPIDRIALQAARRRRGTGECSLGYAFLEREISTAEGSRPSSLDVNEGCARQQALRPQKTETCLVMSELALSSDCFGSPSDSMIQAPLDFRLVWATGSAPGEGMCTSNVTPAPCLQAFHKAWVSFKGYLRAASDTCFAFWRLPAFISPRASNS